MKVMHDVVHQRLKLTHERIGPADIAFLFEQYQHQVVVEHEEREHFEKVLEAES